MQRTRNDPHENATWDYNYDRGGNIISKAKYAYTTGGLGYSVQSINYDYSDSNWGDKLTAFGDKTITYDAIGNPLNDGTWSYTWSAGRQLKQMSKTGTTVQFKYDHNGMRTQKTVTQNGATTTTNYTLHGKLIAHMTRGSNTLHFFYDAQSRPAFVEYNGTMYRYVHNLQGDIVGIVDNNGNLVVEYKYDAWGRCLASSGTFAGSLGVFNPFRYRGYVCDQDEGLYYLKARYYLDLFGKFMNPDIKVVSKGILRKNPFVYCNNMPVFLVDESGLSPQIVPTPSRPNDWDKAYRDPWNMPVAVDIPKKKPSIVRKAAKAVAKTVKDFISSIRFEFALGTGIYGETKVLGALSAAGGQKKDFVKIIWDGERFDVGVELTTLALSGSLGPFSAGGTETYWHSYFNDGCTCEDRSAPVQGCPAWEDRSGFEAEAGGELGLYLIIGATFSITTPLETGAQ